MIDKAFLASAFFTIKAWGWQPEVIHKSSTDISTTILLKKVSFFKNCQKIKKFFECFHQKKSINEVLTFLL